MVLLTNLAQASSECQSKILNICKSRYLKNVQFLMQWNEIKIWQNKIIFNLTFDENLLQVNKYKIQFPQIYVDG
jgi:hypothetical protein